MLGELRPAALKQILEMDLGFDMPMFRTFILQLIKSSCGQFLMHARQWTSNPEYKPIQTMCDYDMLWEGFSCTEPYFDSKNQKIKYFMDQNRQQRECEMEMQFASN